MFTVLVAEDDAKLRRLTRYRYNEIPYDNNGRYLYVKDGDTVWSPTWKPVCSVF